MRPIEIKIYRFKSVLATNNIFISCITLLISLANVVLRDIHEIFRNAYSARLRSSFFTNIRTRITWNMTNYHADRSITEFEFKFIQRWYCLPPPPFPPRLKPNQNAYIAAVARLNVCACSEYIKCKIFLSLLFPLCYPRWNIQPMLPDNSSYSFTLYIQS